MSHISRKYLIRDVCTQATFHLTFGGLKITTGVDFKIVCLKMLEEETIDLQNATKEYCVVIAISKANSSASSVYARNVEGDCCVGQPFRLLRLSKNDLTDIWENEEVTTERIQFGSILACVQIGDEYLYDRNTQRPRQDVDKIQMDISYSDGAFKGIRDAFPDATIGTKGIYQDCGPPKQTICLVSFTVGQIKSERIHLETKLGEQVNLKLNCRENLVLFTSPVKLELRDLKGEDNVGDLALIKMADAECGLMKPYQAVCEGLILRYKPKVISIDEEPVKIEDSKGNFDQVPGIVKFDSGNDVATAISHKLVDDLGLAPNHAKIVKVTIAGGHVMPCSGVQIKIIIRKRKFTVNALVGAVSPGTDLLVGMDIIQHLGKENFTLGSP